MITILLFLISRLIAFKEQSESSSSKFSLRMLANFEIRKMESKESKTSKEEMIGWRGESFGEKLARRKRRSNSIEMKTGFPSVEPGSLSFKTIHRISLSFPLPSTDTNAISRGISSWKKFSPRVFRRRNDRSCCLRFFSSVYRRSFSKNGFSRRGEIWFFNMVCAKSFGKWFFEGGRTFDGENRIFDSRCFRASPRCLSLNSVFELAFNFVSCETAACRSPVIPWISIERKKEKKWVTIKIRLNIKSMSEVFLYKIVCKACLIIERSQEIQLGQEYITLFVLLFFFVE